MILSAVLSAQEPETVRTEETKTKQSKLEEFSAQSGRLFEKKFISIGRFRNIHIQALTITDLSTNERTSGIRFDRQGKTELMTAFIDDDEVEALIKSLNYIKSTVINSAAPVDFTEYQFISRSGFQVGCFSDENRVWVGYLVLPNYDKEGVVRFDSLLIKELLLLTEQAKAKLPPPKTKLQTN